MGYTRIVLGEPVLRGRVKGAPWTPCALGCFDGSDVFGFEDTTMTYIDPLDPSPPSPEPRGFYWGASEDSSFISIDTTVSRSGSNSVKFVNSNNKYIALKHGTCAPFRSEGNNTRTTYVASPGQTCTISAWVRQPVVESLGSSILITWYDSAGSVVDDTAMDSTATASADWQFLEASQVAPSGTAMVYVQLWTTQDDSHWDDVTFCLES